MARDFPEFAAAQTESERWLRQRAAHYAGAREQARSREAKAPSRQAATISVTSCADDAGASGTLRAAVTGAVSGDVIDLSQLQCSTISLQHGQVVAPVADLTIKGPGEQALTIDGGDTDRVFKHSGTGTIAISDLTVAHGRHVDMTHAGYYDGGCVYSLGTVTLDRVTVDSCVTGAAQGAIGGGIFAYGLQMTSSTVSNSKAEGPVALGGGIGIVLPEGATTAVTLTSSQVIGNTATGSGRSSGGGLGVNAADSNVTVSVDSSHFTNNIAYTNYADGGNSSNGGAIFTNLVGIRVKSSVISGNSVKAVSTATRLTAAVGAGVNSSFTFFYGEAARFEDTVVTGNEATGTGPAGWGDSGGLYLFQLHGDTSLATVVLARTTVSDNRAEGVYMGIRGGVGPIRAMTADISDSTFSGNVVSASGMAICGGVEVNDGGHLTSSTISGNTVSNAEQASYGGGLCAYGDIDVTNSTIAFNSAGGNGGGVYFRGRSPRTGDQFVSTLIASNQAGAGADMFAGNWGSPGGTATLLGSNNLIGGADPGVTVPADTLTADPQLLPLADNGGPTWTHALAATSPALDIGSNPTGAEHDQRGGDYVRTFGAGTDIGAFELQPDPIPDAVFADGFDGAE